MKTTPNIQEWHGPDSITCASALADKPYTIFFDSNRPAHPLNQWSFICFNPIEVIQTKNGVVQLNNKEVKNLGFFDFLQSRLDKHAVGVTHHDIPFIGGAAGYWGYDLGRELETLPHNTTDDMDVPDAIIGIYQNVLAFDHIHDKAWFIGDKPPQIDNVDDTCFEPTNIDWQPNISEDQYCDDVQETIDYIYAGEIYQANITRRFEANLPDNFDYFAHYKNLRKINAAPFSAYLNFGDIKISSSSPEQFLSIKNNKVETRPIKGTLPSSEESQTLLTSKKDIAENTMIVDLLRNDLSKVCDYKTVKVPKLCELETFEGLYHLVSTVTGDLKRNTTALDVLKACFPGGSITGAPKIRAMEIIDTIEKNQRGPYCGAIGYIGFNGRIDTSITIRTLIYKNNMAYLQTGCGIVSDSVPTKELNESLNKARKIFDSFNILEE